jgi:hypothetical protein
MHKSASFVGQNPAIAFTLQGDGEMIAILETKWRHY